MIHVKCGVPVFEFDGSAKDVEPEKEFTVSSHDTDDELVVLAYGCTTISVHKKDLVTAVKNATRRN